MPRNLTVNEHQAQHQAMVRSKRAESLVSQFPTLASVPKNFSGVALVLDTYKLYIGNGSTLSPIGGLTTEQDAKLAAFTVDGNGNLVANIVNMTNTLAGLLQIVGTQGELAVATDQDAIVAFNGGTTKPPAVYRPQAVNFAGNYAAMINTNFPADLQLIATVQLQMVQYDADVQNSIVAGWYAADGSRLFITTDGINFSEVDRPLTTVNCNYASDGVNLYAVPIGTSTVGYISAAPFVTWTAVTGLAAATTVWKAPVMVGVSTALSIATGTSNKSCTIDITGTATQYTLPGAAAAWMAPVAPIISDLALGFPFAVTSIASSTRIAILGSFDPDNPGVFSWLEIALPSAIASKSILITKDKIIISYFGSTTLHIADWALDTLNTVHTISAFRTVLLPSTNYLPPTANKSTVAILIDGAGGSAALNYSSDGENYAELAPLIQYMNIVSAGIVTDKALYSSANTNITVPGNINHLGPAVCRNNLISSTGQALFGSPLPRLPLQIVNTAPITGDTVTLLMDTDVVFVNTAGTLLALTILLPTNPYDGFQCSLRFNNIITGLTFTVQGAPSGQVIQVGANTTGTYATAAAKYQDIELLYSMVNKAWSIG